jgi:hypothetical protein
MSAAASDAGKGLDRPPRTAPGPDRQGAAGAAIRIAIWSGPRNISTALLRSWGSRPDTFVCDEPLYAHYLKATGIDHPGRDEVLARHETDWRAVVAWLTGPVPEGRSIFYQKQMAHHLLPEIDRGWIGGLRNAFLIRDPSEMLASLARVLPEPRLEDTGLPQQCELFEAIGRAGGEAPPVIDARDVLVDPEGMLRSLCAALGVPFLSAMLSWEAGPRPTDGVWAGHWYGNVISSTRFQPYRPPAEPLPARLGALLDSCLPFYERLYNRRLIA